ncbi:uncharacterized protein LY89DRAFT_690788, partial [Mollisia scopiformis]
MTSSSFNQFALLPWELRHQVWEGLLPANDDPLLRALTRAIASHILDFPRDKTFYPVHQPSNGANHEDIFALIKNCGSASPYAALGGCAESRAVAFKHLRPLLENSKELKYWLTKRHSYYSPKMVQDRKTQSLFYECKGITDKGKSRDKPPVVKIRQSMFYQCKDIREEWKEGYRLNHLIFWGKAEDEKPREKQAWEMVDYKELDEERNEDLDEEEDFG